MCLWQGCPLSPYLFNLGVEILAAKVRQDCTIQGIKLFSTEHKTTTLFIGNLNSVENSIKLVEQFDDISGLKLNVEKTKAIWLGSWRFNESKPFGLNWTKESVRALGTFISYNMKENNKKNVEMKIDNMITKLDIWQAWSLRRRRCFYLWTISISYLMFVVSVI